MSDTAVLLEQASGVLGEASAYSNRAACWIARAALESAVDDLLAARGYGAPGATMRSRLSALQVAYADEAAVAAQAEFAWSGLSQACHHHAFELTPAGAEVRHMIDLVAALVRKASGPSE